MGSQQARLLRKLRESTLPNNPYMSPLRASDETLRQFPTTYLVVSNLILLYPYSLVRCLLFPIVDQCDEYLKLLF